MLHVNEHELWHSAILFIGCREGTTTGSYIGTRFSFFVFRMYPKYHKVPVYTPLVWKGLDSDPVSWL